MKFKPNNGRPYKRIIFEALLDMFLGWVIISSVISAFDIGFLQFVQSIGGLGVIGGFLSLMYRIYGGKNKGE